MDKPPLVLIKSVESIPAVVSTGCRRHAEVAAATMKGERLRRVGSGGDSLTKPSTDA